MKRGKSYNKVILEVLGTKPIAFNPILAKLAKSATAGLFMSQLLYWWDKGREKGWIFKTIEEIHCETCLGRSEQDRAIKVWKSLGMLEVKLIGLPAKRHFKINIETLIAHLNKQVC
jgi:hypothetical protein